MRHGAIPVLACTFLLGTFMQLPVAMATSAPWPALGHVSANSWIALAVLALFITPVNLACQNLALKRLDASEVANFNNFAPVLTVLWGIWLLGEAVTPALIAGGVLTMLGITWACRPRREPAGLTLDFGDWKSEPRVAGVGTPPQEELALDSIPNDLQNRKPHPEPSVTPVGVVRACRVG
jgi:uncharacterized membrane protein